jgi:site-specific recombinase XerD
MAASVPDPLALEDFRASLVTRHPLTQRAYLGALRDFLAWLATQPGEHPFRFESLTQTAVQGYLDALKARGVAPRTRSRAIAALRRFGQWAVDEGHLRSNPARQLERPTVVALAPTELSGDQRFVLKSLVERLASPRMTAIFTLGYWAGLRVSEVATLRVDQCHVNQRAGTITLLDAKGSKTRTLDLSNAARQALWAYLHPEAPHADQRDPDSLYVFTGQRAAWLRAEGRPDHLSERGIEHLWTALKAGATAVEWEFVKSVRFHDLRHDWAHRARKSGWSLEEIAVYAGHQTKDGAPAIATTARYTLPSRAQLKERLQALEG